MRFFFSLICVFSCQSQLECFSASQMKRWEEEENTKRSRVLKAGDCGWGGWWGWGIRLGGAEAGIRKRRQVGKHSPAQPLSPAGQTEAEQSLLLPCRRGSGLCVFNSGSTCIYPAWLDKSPHDLLVSWGKKTCGGHTLNRLGPENSSSFPSFCQAPV